MSKLTILFFTLFSILLNSQILDKDFTWLDQNDYKSIKEIKIYKNSDLGIVQQFDESGNPIFVKNNEFNGEDVFSVWGYFYQNNKLESIVFGHSNIGFSISEYIYSKNKTEIFSYKEIEDDQEINSFPYKKEIISISSINDLLHSKTLINLKKRKKYLFQIDEFNDNGKIAISVIKDFKGNNQTETIYTYSKNIEKIEYKTGNKNFDSEILKEFDSDGKIINEKYKNTEVLYLYIGNLLSKKSTIESGKLTEEETYEYNRDNKIIQKKTFVSDYDKTFTDKYEYNEKGFLKSVELEGSEGISKYNYEYTYW